VFACVCAFSSPSQAREVAGPKGLRRRLTREGSPGAPAAQMSRTRASRLLELCRVRKAQESGDTLRVLRTVSFPLGLTPV
jgi:hypothetical protein